MPRRLSALLSILLAALVVAPIASARVLASITRATTGSLTIAFEGPLTGSQASNGQDMLRGTQLAVAEINKGGGVLGLKLKLITGNDKADATVGAAVANSLIAQNPFALIGPYNSSVGVENLPLYEAAGVLPVQLTSTDDTTGMGVTVQPKNSQISPVEVQWMTAQKVGKVSILWDPSTYTKGMADRLARSLTKKGVLVTKIKIDPSKKNFTAQVRQALTNNPAVVYASTYFPQGAIIAKELMAQAAQGNEADCFMGLGNQDQKFITQAGVAAASRCTFSGVPTANQFANTKAKAYVKNYTKKFNKAPGTWGTFTYDSVYTLVAAIKKAGSVDVNLVTQKILQTKNLAGVTGPITINATTGNRPNVPIAILSVNASGQFTLESITT